MNIELMAEHLRRCRECKSNGGQCNACTKAMAIMNVMRSADAESLLELDDYMYHQEQLNALQRMHETQLVKDRLVSLCIKGVCCGIILLGIIILGGVLK